MEDPWATVGALAADRTLGAAEIARGAAGALGRLAGNDLRRAIWLLLRGHPSMAPLSRLASDILSADDPRAAGDRFEAMLDADEAASEILARDMPETVLTISASSSVLDAIRRRRPATVVCMRSEPGGEGARLAEAAASWSEVLLIDDDEALATVPAEAVVVGADAVTPTALVNKVKTADLARAARDREVPVLAVAGDAKFVPVELPSEDLLEPVPLDLVTAIAAPSGMLAPAEAGARAASIELHPEVRRLLGRL